MAKYISQAVAKQLDLELFKYYSLDQLMELAGLSVSLAIHDFCPEKSRFLILAGPGNNGGDALVAGRHLTNFGHSCSVFYPKQKFGNLVSQLKELQVPFVDRPEFENYDYIVDGIFGFGFTGSPNAPWDSVISEMKRVENVLSIDVPSGWYLVT
jgi:NAD(P)H-hydrate epimerase